MNVYENIVNQAYTLIKFATDEIDAQEPTRASIERIKEISNNIEMCCNYELNKLNSMNEVPKVVSYLKSLLYIMRALDCASDNHSKYAVAYGDKNFINANLLDDVADKLSDAFGYRWQGSSTCKVAKIQGTCITLSITEGDGLCLELEFSPNLQ